MNKAQLQASLAFNGETLAEAENTLHRMQEQLAAFTSHPPPINL